MQEKPLVSVITPTYNAESFIKETIHSVQNQTLENFEIIIVDDKSSDNTVNIVKELQQKDLRIRLIELSQNQGAAVARNTAIDNAKGQYIAFLDSDDLWLEDKLEKQIAFMQDNNYIFTFSNYTVIDADGIDTGKNIYGPEVVTYKSMLRNPIIGCLTVVLDKSQLTDLQMPNIRTRQDFAFWLKILKTGVKAYKYDEVLAKYRKVPGSISSNKFKAAKKNWYVYREIEGLPLLKTSWYFINYAIRAVWKTYF